MQPYDRFPTARPPVEKPQNKTRASADLALTPRPFDAKSPEFVIGVRDEP